MPRTVGNPKLDSRSARAKLPARSSIYWTSLAPGCALGYRKGRRAAYGSPSRYAPARGSRRCSVQRMMPSTRTVCSRSATPTRSAGHGNGLK